jgi:hypothetical protein
LFHDQARILIYRICVAKIAFLRQQLIGANREDRPIIAELTQRVPHTGGMRAESSSAAPGGFYVPDSEPRNDR